MRLCVVVVIFRRRKGQFTNALDFRLETGFALRESARVCILPKLQTAFLQGVLRVCFEVVYCCLVPPFCPVVLQPFGVVLA